MKPGSLFIAITIAILALAGCGYVGNPMAPTLDIPQTIGDLRVAEYGDRILVEFTIPLLTTEGLPLTKIRSLDLRIGIVPTPWNDSQWEATAKPVDCKATGPGPVTCWAPASDVAGWVGKDVVIRARATGPKGKTSQWSGLKTLPVQPPLASPADVKIENTTQGFSLSWKSPAPHFRIYRVLGNAPADATPELKAEPTESTWLDQDVEFGTSYRYFVQAVAGEYQQSDTAATEPKQRVDDFIPTVPTGLTADQSASAIELSWERNTDARFQGYNVYRSVDGGAFAKIASLITAPTFSDRDIAAGKKYTYRISAVGSNGRESERSSPYEIAMQ